MPLLSSTRVENDNPGSVTVIVAETTGAGPQGDALLDIFISINTDQAEFTSGHTPGYRPSNPTNVIAWEEVEVTQGTTKEFTANIGQAPEGEASSTVVTCVVTGDYAGNFYYQSMQPVLVFS